MSTFANVNHKVIEWAITRAGHKLSDFLAIHPEIQEWINNTKQPTINQLDSFAKSVNTPFGYFFLNELPGDRLPFPYFRTGLGRASTVSLNVLETIKIVSNRQQWLRNYLAESDYSQLPFVNKFKLNDRYKNIAQDIGNTLNLTDGWANQCATWEEALNYLTQKLENVGIIVLFNGVVGNNNFRPIDVLECRGFVMVDDFAPFMFINNADSKAAQMFTIGHELAHIWLGQSAGFDIQDMQPSNDPLEKLCDQVAAEFLVSEKAFTGMWSRNSSFVNLSKYFKVSQIVIARRALDLGKISRAEFFNFYNSYIHREQLKKEDHDGGNFYPTQKKRLSVLFTSFINRAVNENRLLYKEAYQMTGLKSSTYEQFVNKYLSKE